MVYPVKRKARRRESV